MNIHLETARLILREFTPNDVDNLLALDSYPEVRRYVDMPEAPSRADAEQTLLRFLEWYQKSPGSGYWALEEKESGKFLGWLHFRPSREDPEDMTIGWRLMPFAWGKGYATEAAGALLHKGISEQGLRRVVATALTGNAASIRVMEKIGLIFEKTFYYKPGMEAVKYALNKENR